MQFLTFNSYLDRLMRYAMKVVQINAVCGYGSTGIIVEEIGKMLTANNVENYILHTGKNSTQENSISYAGNFAIKVNALLSKILGNYGFNSHYETARLIKEIEKINPDIVHLHNIHGHSVNLKTFFKYLRNKGVRVIWTFHDCWAFTGYCTHFEFLPCEKWKEECSNCLQKSSYSWFFDKSKLQQSRKKELFCSLSDMTIVTPSNWLADLVKSSFLKRFPLEVINNGIDLDVFRRRKQDIISKEDGRIVIMGLPKGNIDEFFKLNNMLDKSRYKLVLAGLSDEKMQILPDSIMGIKRTSDREKLSQIYSAADVFVNLTLGDTFPTVNLESLACGTPIVTYATGGSPETIDSKTGIVVPQKDIKGVCKAIDEICNSIDRSEACRRRAVDLYNAQERFADYLDLYLKRGRFK